MGEKPLKSGDLRILRCLSSEKCKRSRLVNWSGLSDTQVRRNLERLMKRGYAKRKGKGFYVKTLEGFEFEKGRELPLELTFDNPKLVKVINRLPTQAHRIIFWFWLSSIVAKKYLLETELFKDYNPGFVVIGLTGEIKSLIASLMCKVLGLSPEAEYIREVITATRKEILGRKYPVGKGDYRLRASPYFSRIAVCFDEIDKARDKGVWQAILYYLNGKREFEEEKTLVTNKSIVLVSMNPSIKWKIPPEYLRRCFLLDTRPFDLDPRELVDIGEDITHSKIPRINIDNLKVDITHLDKQDLTLLKDLLFEGLLGKDEYRLVNPATLEKVILGWLILTGTHDKTDAIYWAVEGNLTLLQTQGATKKDWRRTLREKWGTYRVGKDPKFEDKWIQETKKLEAEDQVLRDRGREKEIEKRDKADRLERDRTGEVMEARKMRADLKEIAGTQEDRNIITKHLEKHRKDKTPDELKRFKEDNEYYQKLVDSRLQRHRQEQKDDKRNRERLSQAREERRAILRELDSIASELWRNWRGKKEADDLRLIIRRAIKAQAKARYSLWQLREWLVDARERRKSLKRNKPVAPRDAAELWADMLYKGYKGARRLFATPKKTNPPGPEVQGESFPPQEKKDIQDEDGSSWWRPKE